MYKNENQIQRNRPAVGDTTKILSVNLGKIMKIARAAPSGGPKTMLSTNGCVHVNYALTPSSYVNLGRRWPDPFPHVMLTYFLNAP